MSELIQLIENFIANTDFQDNKEKNICLGSGNFANVYVNKIHDVPVCYKKFIKKIITEEKKEEIEKEINLMRRLRHKNIIQYYGTKIVGEEMRIYMEYANMGTLTKWMEKNPVKKRSKEIIMNFFEQMIEGLKYLHSNFVIHRDLKPTNVLLKETEDEGIIIKISDFGTSRQFDRRRTQQTFSEMRTNTFIGTELFMAPEIIEDKEYNYRVDIWSMGCILYMMCFDKYPFEKMPDILFVRVQPYQETEENKIFVEIIKQMIVKEPEKRIKCEEILEIINRSEERKEVEIEKQKLIEQQIELKRKEERLMKEQEEKEKREKERKQKAQGIENKRKQKEEKMKQKEIEIQHKKEEEERRKKEIEKEKEKLKEQQEELERREQELNDRIKEEERLRKEEEERKKKEEEERLRNEEEERLIKEEEEEEERLRSMEKTMGKGKINEEIKRKQKEDKKKQMKIQHKKEEKEKEPPQKEEEREEELETERSKVWNKRRYNGRTEETPIRRRRRWEGEYEDTKWEEKSFEPKFFPPRNGRRCFHGFHNPPFREHGPRAFRRDHYEGVHTRGMYQRDNTETIDPWEDDNEIDEDCFGEGYSDEEDDFDWDLV